MNAKVETGLNICKWAHQDKFSSGEHLYVCKWKEEPAKYLDMEIETEKEVTSISQSAGVAPVSLYLYPSKNWFSVQGYFVLCRGLLNISSFRW